MTLTLPALLDSAALRSPENEVVFPGQRTGWPELAAAAGALAGGLAAAGVRKGDRVLVLLPAGLDMVVALVAVSRIGAIPVPVNPRGTPADIGYQLVHSGATVALSCAELAHLLGERPPVPVFAPTELATGQDVPEIAAEPDDPMIILYTSGTTAKPKGVVHTHASFTSLGQNLVQRLRLSTADRFWCPLPLFHCGGIDLLVGSMAAACTLVHVGTFNPDTAIDQLITERATVAFPAFDTIWLPVLEHPRFDPELLATLRVVINVGNRERMLDMQRRLPHAVQISCLGCTESGGFCCVGEIDDPLEQRSATSGVPLSGMQARVVDPETSADCPPGQPGEFLFRGVSRFARYHADEQATAERIDADGWFHSGDLVRADEHGRLSFLSRLRDVLKVGGENVAAVEVEGRLAEHPAVGVVAVVAAPDARLGEVPAAFVQRAGEVTEQELIAHCLGRLATYKVPRYVVFVEEWPMSGTKIQKHVLRERIAAELAERGITEAPRLSARGLSARAIPAERPVD